MADITPADAVGHRAAAGAALARAANAGPATDLYRNLVLTAIARALLAIEVHLEPPPAPQIPGLPLGYQLETIQAGGGNRRWGYVLTCPDGAREATRYRWTESETALADGIRRAVSDQATREGNAS